MLNQKGRRIARTVLLVQAIAAAILVALMGLIFGIEGAKTAFAGACIGLIPNMIFAHYMFRFGGARAASQVVQSFYLGEMLKMLFTIVLFVIAFVILNGPWFPLFAVFIAITVLQWITPFLNLKIN
ncbi:F0F1 ATP synthase subunit I [Lysobacter sp. N42]|nr:F0F1 ATP synthase subunit I [Aliidiomarina sp. B3213]TCZ91021.1 F0F1 ATP synthase subunit I [Lysobacter sp. N42]